MSKYNNIKSIPIDSIPKEEISIAIKEWAEGDDAMEELLWACYNNNIITHGCHAGSNPYLQIEYEKTNNNLKEILTKMMNTVIPTPGSCILINPDGGNPFSGQDWYKPSITLGSDTEYKDVADTQFKTIVKVINDEIEIPNIVDSTPLIDLADFFDDKLTGLLLRLIHTNNNEYTFSIEGFMNPDSELYMYLDTTLSKLDYVRTSPFPGSKRFFWELTAHDEKELNKTLQKTAKIIIETYSIETPKTIEEVASFNTKAQIMRLFFPNEFTSWLDEEEKKRR